MRRRRTLLEILHAGPSARTILFGGTVVSAALAALLLAVPADRLPGPHWVWPVLFAAASVSCAWNLARPWSRAAAVTSGFVTFFAFGSRAVVALTGLAANGHLGLLDTATAWLATIVWMTHAAMIWIVWATIVAPATGVSRRIDHQRQSRR